MEEEFGLFGVLPDYELPVLHDYNLEDQDHLKPTEYLATLSSSWLYVPDILWGGFIQLSTINGLNAANTLRKHVRESRREDGLFDMRRLLSDIPPTTRAMGVQHDRYSMFLLFWASIVCDADIDCFTNGHDNEFQVILVQDLYHREKTRQVNNGFMEHANNVMSSCKGKLMIVPVHIDGEHKEDGHSNILVINRHNNSYMLFEPHGTNGRYYSETMRAIHDFVIPIFARGGHEFNSMCRYSKFQRSDSLCTSWTLLFASTVLANPNHTFDEIAAEMGRWQDIDDAVMRFTSLCERTVRVGNTDLDRYVNHNIVAMRYIAYHLQTDLNSLLVELDMKRYEIRAAEKDHRELLKTRMLSHRPILRTLITRLREFIRSARRAKFESARRILDMAIFTLSLIEYLEKDDIVRVADTDMITMYFYAIHCADHVEEIASEKVKANLDKLDEQLYEFTYDDMDRELRDVLRFNAEAAQHMIERLERMQKSVRRDILIESLRKLLIDRVGTAETVARVKMPFIDIENRMLCLARELTTKDEDISYEISWIDKLKPQHTNFQFW